MKKSFSFYLLLFIVAGLGCDMYHSRECPAFYYDYNQWQPIDENETITFLTSDDKEVKFSLESSSLSEPDTQGEIGGNCCTNEPETIICMMDAYFSYHSDDLDIDLDFYFIQNEKFEEPIENQNIIHSIHFKKSDGSTSSNSGFFEIQPELKSVKPNHKIIDSINLNNQTYYDLIQIKFDTTSTQQNALFQCSKLLASKGKGIVYLQDKKGIEYFLKE